MAKKIYNPFTDAHNPGRHEIVAKETSYKKFVIDHIEADPAELANVNQLQLMREMKIEFPIETIEALKQSFKFRSVKFTKSETLTPENVF